MKLFPLIAICLTFSAVLGDNPDWSKLIYRVNGTIRLPYGDIVEQFQAWIDPANNMSRIDYYNGMNSILYLNGPGFKIVPKPPGSEAEYPLICYNVTGGIGFQTILPDISQFKLVSSAQPCKYGDKVETCTLYRLSETIQSKTNIYDMYVYQENIPVLFNFTGYDALMGSHYDEYIFSYDVFKELDEIPAGVFDYPARMRKCGQYPGPGLSQADLNPMAEFMGGTDYNEKDKETSTEFENFKKKYMKNYESEIEHEDRKSIFRQARRYINSKNRQNLGFTLAINHLSDLNEKELKLRNGYRYTGIGESHRLKSSDVLMGWNSPDSVNWTAKGAVNPPKDQGICGSCWSFGTTGTLEGSYYLKYGKLLDLSEQSLIDCTWDQGNNGCDGGETERVGEWLLEPGKGHCVVTRDEYAATAKYEDTKRGYLMADGFCHWAKTNKDIGVKIKNYTVSPQDDVEALRQYCAIVGPIQVAIDASRPSFSTYSSGVYYDPTCGNKPENLDHSVLLVGYGSENGQDYWLIKNSWSTHWGDNGYVKMSTKDNNCGVATDAVFFTLA